jgi:HEAT repeats/Putative zinc-finger
MKHDEITCTGAREQLALLLYGELDFDQEERIESHLDVCGECRTALAEEKATRSALDSIEIGVSPALLRECRENLSLRLLEEASRPAVSALLSGSSAKPSTGWWDSFVDAITLRNSDGTPRFAAGYLRPVGALTLVAMGFFAAQFVPQFMTRAGGGLRAMGMGDVGASRVRYIEPSADGRVHIVLDETRQRIVSGTVDDQKIQALLIAAAKDPTDPGLRAETVDILTSRAHTADVRDALVFALQKDENAGVRMKAMEALKPFVNEPEVRTALTHVLLSDANPGLRTQAIDLLTGGANSSVDRNVDRQIVGALQELMQRGEQQGYVRERARHVLQAVNASLETY